MRTFFKYLLAVIGGILAFFALNLASVWAVVGSPSHIADTVSKVASSSNGGSALGGLIVNQVLEGADPQTVSQLEPERPKLAAAAGAAIAGASEEIRGLIDVVVGSTESRTPVRIDMAPLLGKVLVAMHGVDSQVPTQLDGEMAFDVNPAELPPLAAILSLLGAWWILAVLSLIALVGAALCDRRGGLRRYRVAGITLAISSAIVIILGFSGGIGASNVSMDDAQASALVSAIVDVVRSATLLIGGIALIVAIVAIVLSVVVKARGQEAGGGSAAAGGAAGGAAGA